jgi:hypothetical protein
MDVQTISIALGGIGLFIAAINSIISSRKADQQRQTEIQTRQAELLMQLYDRWSSKDFRRDSWDLGKVRGYNSEDIRRFFDRENLDDIIKLTTQATFYEGVGVLVEEGLIDINLVDKLLRNNILGNWESLEPLIREMRHISKRVYDDKFHTVYDTWEQLYNRIKQLPAHSTA